MTSKKTSTPAEGYRARVLAGMATYKPDDREPLLAFRASMYGASSYASEPECLSWLYERHWSAGGPHLWLYRKDTQLLGQQGALPTTLHVGARTYQAGFAIELMVHTSARLRGIGPLLVEHCRKSFDLTMGIDVAADAAKALLRDDWVDLGSLPLYVRPIQASVALPRRVSGWRGRALGTLLDAPLAVFDRVADRAARLQSLTMQPIAHFDARFDALWARVAPLRPVIARRDSRSLGWRFTDCPHAGRYQPFAFEHRGELVGYAVLRLGEKHGMSAAFLVDFLAEPRWLPWLLARCIAWARRANAANLYVPASLGGSDAPLRALGFVRRSSGWRIMFKADRVPDEDVRLMRNPASWYLTAADAAIDLPREGIVFATTD